MSPKPSVPSSFDELAAALARAHRCPPGCPGCAAEQDEAGIPDPIADWADFVAGGAALRAVNLAKRNGQPFPTLTNDDVTQWCIEEAVFERAALLEAQANEHANADPDAPPGPPGPVNAAHQEALERARAFSRGADV